MPTPTTMSIHPVAAYLPACDAEEVVAVVFLEAWRSRGRVHFVDGSLLPWLLVVTTNAIRNLQRSRRRWSALLTKLPASPNATDASEMAEDHLVAKGASSEIRRAIASLGARDALLVELVLVNEVSLRDAAVLLGVSESAARSRLHRARSHLRATLQNGTCVPLTGP